MAHKDISEYGFGQMGSVFTDTANAPIEPPKGTVFVAITFLADTKLETHASATNTGLVADTSDPNAEYVGTAVAAHNATIDQDPSQQTTVTGCGGKIIDNGNTFPRGITIYGRWTRVEIGNGQTGALIAYIGS